MLQHQSDKLCHIVLACGVIHNVTWDSLPFWCDGSVGQTQNQTQSQSQSMCSSVKLPFRPENQQTTKMPNQPTTKQPTKKASGVYRNHPNVTLEKFFTFCLYFGIQQVEINLLILSDLKQEQFNIQNIFLKCTNWTNTLEVLFIYLFLSSSLFLFHFHRKHLYKSWMNNTNQGTQSYKVEKKTLQAQKNTSLKQQSPSFMENTLLK